MNRKKRYSNPLEVRLEIIRLRAQSASDIRKAEKAEVELQELRDDPEHSEGWKEVKCDELRKKANRFRKHHSYLLDRKIPMLVRVLAKLNTKPLIPMDDSSELEETIK